MVPAVGLLLAGQQPGDGGLAGAALADERDDRAAVQAEGHVPDRVQESGRGRAGSPCPGPAADSASGRARPRGPSVCCLPASRLLLLGARRRWCTAPDGWPARGPVPALEARPRRYAARHRGARTGTRSRARDPPRCDRRRAGPRSRRRPRVPSVHRGRNGQPGGGSSRSGGVPGMPVRSLRGPRSDGNERSSRLVYGCEGS